MFFVRRTPSSPTRLCVPTNGTLRSRHELGGALLDEGGMAHSNGCVLVSSLVVVLSELVVFSESGSPQSRSIFFRRAALSRLLSKRHGAGARAAIRGGLTDQRHAARATGTPDDGSPASAAPRGCAARVLGVEERQQGCQESCQLWSWLWRPVRSRASRRSGALTSCVAPPRLMSQAVPTNPEAAGAGASAVSRTSSGASARRSPGLPAASHHVAPLTAGLDRVAVARARGKTCEPPGW